MELELPPIKLTKAEQIFMACIQAACLELRDAHPYIKDLNGETGETFEFAMVCGGWVRDKVRFSNLDTRERLKRHRLDRSQWLCGPTFKAHSARFGDWVGRTWEGQMDGQIQTSSSQSIAKRRLRRPKPCQASYHADLHGIRLWWWGGVHLRAWLERAPQRWDLQGRSKMQRLQDQLDVLLSHGREAYRHHERRPRLSSLTRTSKTTSSVASTISTKLLAVTTLDSSEPSGSWSAKKWRLTPNWRSTSWKRDSRVA